ncbi:hypothetical protein SY2F82_41600 [Streptomyces sp. Y2F8-2]|uniref:serine/threonine-protein kinase n=1 Tax=Streptomyces sp. Y2F8-2 TaxID=2759675 RepID=UPI001A580F47|nr:serine/threonine-protein kinase [Streptomyces sp. Y2F8-2]GHK02363.1 hypothetical protein SY2F82_41600 [Streptomyces sp. Y2F8-2]
MPVNPPETPRPSQPSELPEQIGPYRLIRRLGSGGMGTVYYATDPAGGEPLAVKVLHQSFAADPAHRARFRRETTTLRKVTSPYLVPLIAADPDAPLPWLATAYVHGDTLHEHVQNHGAMAPGNLLTFAAAVAHALACIHDAGVAHRDLKPTNVLLSADGPRVVDFGIAHHLDATAITETSVTTGTPGWMAPEQLTDGLTLPACDIFAWGLLVAYASAGSHPFGTPTGITHRIISAAPSLRGVPDALLPLVREALDKEPERRPSAAEIAERTASAYGPSGTLVFPTLAYTRTSGRSGQQGDSPAADTGVTVPPARARWDVPLPVGQPGEAQPGTAQIPSGSPAAVEPTPPKAGIPQVSSAPTQTAPPPRPTAPSPQAPSSPTSPGSDGPSAGRPLRPAERRRHPRRRALYALAAAVVVGSAAGGVAAAMAGSSSTHRHQAAGPVKESKPAASNSRTPSATPAVDSTPDAQETTSPAPQPMSVFGGLHVTVPSDFEQAAQRSDDNQQVDGEQDSTTATAEADFSLVDHPDSGIRIVYSPTLTVDQIRDGQRDAGAMWSVEDDNGNTTDESVIAVHDGPLTGIGGKRAISWVMTTDVLPDYDGARKNTYRVWWLPYSKYLLYTYGKQDKAADTAVDELIRAVTFERTKMPRDCADAVVALDKTAASGDTADDHGALGNCLDAAVNGADQLDPGTVSTKGEAACVALAESYRMNGPDLSYDGAKAYEELRPWCDLPGAVNHPRLPDWTS